jgi:hypothetical protein
MTKLEVILSFRRSTNCSCIIIVKILKENLNYLRLHLNKGKNGNSIVITHEQGILTSFLRLDSLGLILVHIS